MSERRKILTFAASFVGLILIYFFFFQEDKKRFNWSEDYILDKERPYGTWLVLELLKEYDKDRKFSTPSSPLDQSLKRVKKNSNYIFIGEEIYLEDVAADSLVSFVKRGNNAFIFTRSIPKELIDRTSVIFEVDTLYHSYEYFSGDSTETWINREKEELSKAIFIPYRTRFETSYYEWNFFDGNLYTHDYQELGSFNSYREEEMINGVNFYKISYGEGAFYFHTQPILFSNIVLKEGDMLSYCNEVFSYLNEGEIIWEEHNWRFNKPNKKTWLFKPNYFQQKESPLKLILSDPSLKWAWYLLLLFVLLFILFNGKRRKGIIEVLPNKKNTSLDQIKTLSNLYSFDKDRYVIAAKLVENLLWYLQTELRLDIHENKKKLMKDVAVKTRIPENEITSIFNRWERMEMEKEISMDDFIAFNKEIDNFYIRLKA